MQPFSKHALSVHVKLEWDHWTNSLEGRIPIGRPCSSMIFHVYIQVLNTVLQASAWCCCEAADIKTQDLDT